MIYAATPDTSSGVFSIHRGWRVRTGDYALFHRGAIPAAACAAKTETADQGSKLNSALLHLPRSLTTPGQKQGAAVHHWEKSEYPLRTQTVFLGSCRRMLHCQRSLTLDPPQGFQLRYSVAPDIPELRADPDAIQQAILNL